MFRWINSIVVIISVFVLAGCAALQHPYIEKDEDIKLRAVDSSYHAFTRIRVSREDDHLVVYGKVQHSHGYCRDEGHVDMAVTNAQGQPVGFESLPLRPGSYKLRGWIAANFRRRFQPEPGPNSQVVLTFHDGGCSTGTRVDCGKNGAMKIALTSSEGDNKPEGQSRKDGTLTAPTNVSD
jgi:hypothetical protein